MGSNQSSPIYFIWNFISINFTYLNIFRNTYKFVGPLVILLIINYIFIKDIRLIKLLYVYIFYVVITLYVVNIHPLNTRYYSTPQYWIDAEQYIKKNIDSRDNILLLPFEKNTIYEWGSYNGYIYGSPLNIKNPILYNTLSDTNNLLINNIRDKFLSDNPCEILKINNIKIIINRNDMISKEYYDINSLKCVLEYKNFGPLELIYIK